MNHAAIIYNKKNYEKYSNFTDSSSDEEILFHGTDANTFDGLFQKHFQYHSGAKRADEGWYGQGIYFSSSPKEALNYAKSNQTISYLICGLVRLGKTLTVTDMRYKVTSMHSDYDIHYVPVRIDGNPVSEGESPAFEEFAIKRSEQIAPLCIVGILKYLVSQCGEMLRLLMKPALLYSKQ